MSIYSGFATRSLEQTYDQLTSDMLFVLQKRIIKFYNNEETDEDKFYTIFSHLYHQMHHLQKNKYLEPKNTEYVSEMFSHIKQMKEQRSHNLQEDLKKFQNSHQGQNLFQPVKKKNTEGQQSQALPSHVPLIMQSTVSTFGKIRKQLQKNKSSEKSFNLQGYDFSNDIKGGSKTYNLISNPEEKSKSKESKKPSRIFSSNGRRPVQQRNSEPYLSNEEKSLKRSKLSPPSPSNHKELEAKLKNPAQMVVKEYLEKTNKNYLRGYRKRKIKESTFTGDTQMLNRSKSRIPKFSKQKRLNFAI